VPDVEAEYGAKIFGNARSQEAALEQFRKNPQRVHQGTKI
jgi:hypothetical protein